MTLEQLRQHAEDLRCTVTFNRCRDFGCSTPGATIMPADYRCPTCAVYWGLQALTLPTIRVLVPVEALPEPADADFPTITVHLPRDSWDRFVDVEACEDDRRPADCQPIDNPPPTDCQPPDTSQ